MVEANTLRNMLSNSGFFQIMSVATSVIVESRGVESDSYRFAMMYTPMNTGVYIDSIALF